MLSNGSTAMAGRSGSAANAGAKACAPSSDRRLARRRCVVTIHLGVHVAHEAQALARDGADQLLAMAVVADRLARGVNAAGQRRIGHDPAAPDRRDEIVLGDDAIAVLHHVDQQVEYLRLDCNRLGAAAQLAPVDIKRVIGKDKLHVAAPTGLPVTFSIDPEIGQKRDVAPVPGCAAGLVHGRDSRAQGALAHKKFRISPEKIHAVRSAASSLPSDSGLCRSATCRHPSRAADNPLERTQPWRSRQASSPAPACCRCSATASTITITVSRDAAGQILVNGGAVPVLGGQADGRQHDADPGVRPGRQRHDHARREPTARCRPPSCSAATATTR